MNLFINAIPLTDGGGRTGLVGYTSALTRQFPDVKVSIAASQQTLQFLTSLPVTQIPVISSTSLARAHFQLTELGSLVKAAHADVVLTTNSMIQNCPVPQVVHHRNLWCFEGPMDRSPPEAGAWKVPLLRAFAAQAIRRAAANMFVSNYLRQAAERKFPESRRKNYVVANGVRNDARHECQSPETNNEDAVSILSLSYANHQKNNETAVRALAVLVQIMPQVNWQLRFGGGGNWSSIAKLATSLGVGSRVRFLGYLSSQEIQREWKIAFCLIFTSFFESFGNPPLEAMATGCPVIAANATAIPEVIGSAGILFQPLDHVALAESIIQITANRDVRHRLVAEGLTRVKGYSWDESARKMYDIFTRVSERRKHRTHF